jgi:hypothetical protein
MAVKRFTVLALRGYNKDPTIETFSGYFLKNWVIVFSNLLVTLYWTDDATNSLLP